MILYLADKHFAIILMNVVSITEKLVVYKQIQTKTKKAMNTLREGFMTLFSVLNVNFKDIIGYAQIMIEEGETTFICGKSGSGKSTLLKLLNATVSADQGEILYRNKPIADYDTISLRREVTLVSQNVFLFDDTIRGNFQQFYGYREKEPPREAEMIKYLSLCMADFSLDANCRELSGGERQRVFISICLSLMPKVLMLDEPTSALDELTAVALMHRLKEYCIKKGISLIAISHDKTLAKRYADKIIDLNLEV